jgi:hypothetical protein
MSSQACGQLLLDAVLNPSLSLALDLRAWDDLLRLARRANLISRLAASIQQAGMLEQMPSAVRPHLHAALTLAQHQRQAVIWEARHICVALHSLGIPIVLLKGAAYSMGGLKAAKGRLFGDVDILVPEVRINEVEAALMLHGWSSGGVDPYDDRYYRLWMHELPPLVNLKRGTVIDVHHNILPRTARNHPPAEKLLADSVALPEAPFHVLSACDMVLHAATHLFHEGELHNGLRDLFDLDSLLQELSTGDVTFWQKLPLRAKELDLEWPLRLAFRYLERFLDTPIPEAAKAALKQSPLRDRLLDTIYLGGFLPDHPLSNDYRALLARGLAFLRGHALRMPMHLLALHLGRKAVMRMYKNTSRST